MDKSKQKHYTGSAYAIELKTGTAYRISGKPQEIEGIVPDDHGNIHLSLSKRKDPSMGATHNVYERDPNENYLSDPYSVVNLSLDKEQLLKCTNPRGYFDVVALPLSEESTKRDKAKSNFLIKNYVPAIDKDTNPQNIIVGKGWNMRHEKTADIKKNYVGNAWRKEHDGVTYINAFVDKKLFSDTEAKNNNVYINIAAKKDKEGEYSLYTINTKNDKYALYTLALNKEKLLTVPENDKGFIPIAFYFKKEESIGKDNANLNVKGNAMADNNDYVGKGWTKDSMYWMKERPAEVLQAPALEILDKQKGMEGKGLTNYGLHFFQTAKLVPADGQTQDSVPNTSNSYFVKDSLVYHENSQNSILPQNAYPFEDFMKNYESFIVSKDFRASSFYNVEFLPEKEKAIFVANAPIQAEQSENKEEKKTTIEQKSETKEDKNPEQDEKKNKSINAGNNNKKASSISM